MSKEFEQLVESKREASERISQSSPFTVSEDLNVCGICFVNQIEMALQCGHFFCDHCITDWRKKQATCPMCRFDHQTTAYLMVDISSADMLQMRADLMIRLRLVIADVIQERPNTVNLSRSGSVYTIKELVVTDQGMEFE